MTENHAAVTERSPEHPIDDNQLVRLARVLDGSIYRIETALVTIAALVMTATVTLAIVHRSFSTQDSLLAKKLLVVFGWFGASQDASNLAFMTRWVSPPILALIVFFIGRSIYLTAARRRSLSPSRRQTTVAGLGSIVLAYGGLQIILNLSSQWVCSGLVVIGTLAWCFSSIKAGRYFDTVLSLILMVLGCWACTTLRPGYSWAQELSLILLAWMAFLGGSMATRAGRHIQVDALSKVVPVSLRPWTRALGFVIATLFCGYLTYLAYRHVFGATGDFYGGEIRPATRLPAWVIILSAVVSFGLMTVRFGAFSVDAFVNRKQPTRELTH